MRDIVYLLISGCDGIGIVVKAALEDGGPAAVIALAQARCRVAELFPARMGQLDLGATILWHKADIDQLLLPGRQPENPGKREAMRRVIGQYRSPGGFESIGRAFENTSADPRLDRAAHRIGAR